MAAQVVDPLDLEVPQITALKDPPWRRSFSQLMLLHPYYRDACPAKYAYRYRTDLPEKRSWQLVLGSALDDAADRYFQLRIIGRSKEEATKAGHEAVGKRVEQDFHENPELAAEELKDFPGRDPVELYQSLGHQAFDVFLTSEGDKAAAVCQDRHEFKIDLGDRKVTIVGYSDRIDQDGTLVDHKLSGSPRWTEIDDPDWTPPEDAPERVWNERTKRWNKAKKPEAPKLLQWEQRYLSEKSDQLLCYALSRWAEEKRRGEALDPPLNGKARLVVVYAKRSLKVPQVHSVEIDLDFDRGQELLYRFGQAERIVQAGRFPLRPGKACDFCSFVERCRADQDERGTGFIDRIDIPF